MIPTSWLRKLRPRKAVLIGFLLFVATASSTHVSRAQTPSTSGSLDLFQRPLNEALKLLISNAQLSIAYRPADVAGKMSTCAASEGTPEELLACVLTGTGLTFRKLRSGTFAVEPVRESAMKAAASPNRETPALRRHRHTISGYVVDAATGEKLAGANIVDTERMLGTPANRFGFYSLTLPEGPVSLRITFVGYEDRHMHLTLSADTSLTVSLESSPLGLGDVEITAMRTARIEDGTQMSAAEVPIAQIQKLPALLGEVDVLKTLQLLPGVQSGNEGMSGMYVRGGGPDQNLILIDGVPVYNAHHLFGFFSIIDGDAVKNVDLIKGGFPARYGGRLSSVVDVSLREGNMKEFGAVGTIGLLSSKLTTEGPIVPGRSSFIVSGRRTYADLLTRPFMQLETGVAGYHFNDLTAKVNHIFSPRDRVYLSAYFGDDLLRGRRKRTWGSDVDDKLSRTDEARIRLGWGNRIASLRWNRVFAPRLFANATASYNRYALRTAGAASSETVTSIDTTFEQSLFEHRSQIEDIGGRVDFDFVPGPRHYVRFGGEVMHHTFQPGAAQYLHDAAGRVDVDTSLVGAAPLRSLVYRLYLEDDMRLSDRFSVNAGVHASLFDTGRRTYGSVQPRFAARLEVRDGWALKASYARMQQHVHLLVNSGFILPTDLWLPPTDRVSPEESWQIAAGLAHTYRDVYEVSVEAYYKPMDGLIAYKPGAEYMDPSQDWQDQVEVGRGWAAGAELFVQKKAGRTTGWLGYTLAWSRRHFPETAINFGEPFPFRYDRRHDLAIVLMHRLTKKIDVSGSWVFSSGAAVTLPEAKYWYRPMHPGQTPFLDVTGDTEVEAYGGRNGYRMPPHHRLDLSLDYHFVRSAKRERTLSFGLYNAYSRRNPLYMYIRTVHEFNDQNELEWRHVPTKFSLFPILPSVRFRMGF